MSVTKEAKSHHFTNDWIAPGERVALEVLARDLFVIIAETSKLQKVSGAVPPPMGAAQANARVGSQ